MAAKPYDWQKKKKRLEPVTFKYGFGPRRGL